MRLSGLISGMDTESIIQQLVSAKQTKVDDAKKAQTKLEWCPNSTILLSLVNIQRNGFISIIHPAVITDRKSKRLNSSH